MLAPSLTVFRNVVLIKVSNHKMDQTLEKGLDSLCLNKDLVIRPADKGGDSGHGSD